MEQKIEIWKPVVGYEGYYEVSNMGRVRSEDRIDSRGCFRKEKILKSCKDKHGYLRLQLCKNGKRCLKAIHQLVAQAFIPNPDNLQYINHKDECKTNNFVFINSDGTVDFEKSNLEWCSKLYNNTYNDRHKLIGLKNRNGKCSKRIYQYTLDCKFVREWESTMEIQRQLGFKNNNISYCCNGKTQTAYGFIWRYADEVDKEKGAA